MVTLRHISSSESETIAIAMDFAGRLKPGDVVLLYGELGAGKTAFTRGVVTHFRPGITTQSPTFSLVNVYPTDPVVYHLDLYRVENDGDLADLGIEEFFGSSGITVVEWAEKCERLVPLHHFRVKLMITGETSREVSIEEVGDAGISG